MLTSYKFKSFKMIRYIGSIRHVRRHATKTVPEHLKRNPKEIRVSSTGFTKLQDVTAKAILGKIQTYRGTTLDHIWSSVDTLEFNIWFWVRPH